MPSLQDGETFTIDDGFHSAVEFEFDDDGQVSFNRIAVPFATGDTAKVVGLSMTTAINGVGTTLLVNAVASPSFVTLTNDRKSAKGNRPLIENVGAVGFTVMGMSGGTAGDCGLGAGCASGDDCASGGCQPNKTCQ